MSDETKLNACKECKAIPSTEHNSYGDVRFNCVAGHNKDGNWFGRESNALADWNEMNPTTPPEQERGEVCPECGEKMLKYCEIDGVISSYTHTCNGTGKQQVGKEGDEHKMKCGVCGELFDMRNLDEVCFHETHKPAPDIQYSGSKRIEPPAPDPTQERVEEVKKSLRKVYGNDNGYGFTAEQFAEWHLSTIAEKDAQLAAQRKEMQGRAVSFERHLKMWQCSNIDLNTKLEEQTTTIKSQAERIAALENDLQVLCVKVLAVKFHPDDNPASELAQLAAKHL